MPSLPVRLWVTLSVFLMLKSVDTGALNVPFFARVASSNQCGWYPEREGRTLDWGEKYLLSVGIDSLRQGSIGLNLELKAEELLGGFRPALNTLLLSWERGSHSLEIGTKSIGIANAYHFSQRLVSYPSYDGWLFETSRYNAVEYAYRRGGLYAKTALGGNQISRGMATAALFYTPYGQEINAGLRASVSDSHWHSPSLIANAGMSLNLGAYHQRVDVLTKQVLPHNNRPSKQEYAFATEIGFQLFSHLGVAMGGLYENREYAPRTRSEFHCHFDKDVGPFTVSPGFSSILTNDDREDTYNLLLNWQMYESGKVGLIYKYKLGPQDEIQHVFALQTDIRLDF